MTRLRRDPLLTNDAYWAKANAAFGRRVVQSGFGNATAVYGFNAAAVEMFEAARESGRQTILDQTMAAWGPVAELIAQESHSWPDWELDADSRDSAGRLAERESQEWSQADLIICGSQHVVDTVAAAGGPAERCRVVPYGYDGNPATEHERLPHKGPLRVLFIGTVDLRKGVPYLLEAARHITPSEAEFRIVGPQRVQEAALSQLRQRIDLIGPVPRSEVHQHYRWADVFVLPTLAEGSANVCYEAMSHGLPVITTPNAGSVVRHGIDGWIVPPRHSDAIRDCLKELIDNPVRVEEASHAARRRATEFTWDRYMETLARTLRDVL